MLQELYFPTPLKDAEGHVVPAPSEALFFYQGFRNHWFLEYNQDPTKIPNVDLHQVKDDKREGYVVQTFLVVK